MPSGFSGSGGIGLTETKKHCNTCACSYYTKDREWPSQIQKTRQHCCNPEYNATDYTSDMYLEDWGRSYCRFWTPKEERNVS